VNVVSAIPISFVEARKLTLDFLNGWMNKLPAAQRNNPTIVFDMRTWSIPAMVGQVQMNSDVGQRYVAYYVGSLKNYVIR